MVTRVALTLIIAAFTTPVTAQSGLSYEIDNFTQLPESSSQSTPHSLQQIRYNLDGLLFDRVPDYVLLAYKLDGLIGYTPQYRNGRDVGPLPYDFRGLLVTIDRGDGVSAAAAP